MPPLFVGQFQFKLDQRGRLRIPVRWREALGDERLVTAVMPVHRSGLKVSCLAVWSEAVFAQQLRELQAARDRSAEPVADETRLLSATRTTHMPDASCRLKFDFAQLEKAGLAAGAAVILAGVLDRFEVWDPETWRKIGDEDATRAWDAFRKLI